MREAALVGSPHSVARRSQAGLGIAQHPAVGQLCLFMPVGREGRAAGAVEVRVGPFLPRTLP